jgi:hypothetical protein
MQAARPASSFVHRRSGVRLREGLVAYTDSVDDSGDDSFPASDPPSWWAGPDVPRPAKTQSLDAG